MLRGSELPATVCNVPSGPTSTSPTCRRHDAGCVAPGVAVSGMRAYTSSGVGSAGGEVTTSSNAPIASVSISISYTPCPMKRIVAREPGTGASNSKPLTAASSAGNMFPGVAGAGAAVTGAAPLASSSSAAGGGGAAASGGRRFGLGCSCTWKGISRIGRRPRTSIALRWMMVRVDTGTAAGRAPSGRRPATWTGMQFTRSSSSSELQHAGAPDKSSMHASTVTSASLTRSTSAGVSQTSLAPGATAPVAPSTVSPTSSAGTSITVSCDASRTAAVGLVAAVCGGSGRRTRKRTVNRAPERKPAPRIVS